MIAGRANGQIADQMQRPKTVVDWYERLFFDIRGRSRAFVEQQVVQPLFPIGPKDVRRIWAFWAIHGGKHVLDAVLSDFRRANRPDYSHYFTERPEVGRDSQRVAVQTAILDLIIRADPESESRIARALVRRGLPIEYADPNAAAICEMNSVAESILRDARGGDFDLKPTIDTESDNYPFNAVAKPVLELRQTA